MKKKTKLADLYAQVYARPHEDGPRLVLADALLEQGDPHGELIVLQCHAEQTPERVKKQAALIRKHAEAFMGDLAPAIRKQGRYGEGKPLFRRGFLARATVSSSGTRLAEDPAWATLEELWFWGNGLRPVMKHARVLHEPDLDELLGDGHTWDVEELHLNLRDLDDAVRLESDSRLPRLSRLILKGEYRWLLESPRVSSRLTHLEVMLDHGDPGGFVVGAQGLGALKTLTIRPRMMGISSEWLIASALHLERDHSGAFTVGTLEPTVGTYDASTFDPGIVMLLEQIALSSLTVVSKEPLDAKQEAAIAKAASSHGVQRLDMGGKVRTFAAKAPAKKAAKPAKKTSRCDLETVSRIAFSPEGDRLFVAAREGVVVVDAHTHQKVGLHRTEERAQTVAVSKRWIVSTDYGNVCIFDRKGKRLHRLTGVAAADINGVAISPDETRVAVGAENKHVVLIDPVKGDRTPPMKHENVMNLAYSPDGKYLAVALLHAEARVIDVAKRRLVHKLVLDSPVTDARFSPDGARVIATSYDSTVRAFALETGAEVARFARDDMEKLSKGARACAFAPDGSLAVAWDDGQLTLHDGSTLKELRRTRVEKEEALVDVAISSKGTLAVAHDNGVVFVNA